jgi:hypothetical protein
MKKHIVIALAAIVLASVATAQTSSVSPQSLQGIALYRDTAAISYSTNIYYTQGSSILFTNITCYSTGTNASAVQNLSNVTVEVAMSTSPSTTGTWVQASVMNAASNAWKATYTTLPASATVYWQTRITDIRTNIYYYQMQMLYGTAHL